MLIKSPQLKKKDQLLQENMNRINKKIKLQADPTVIYSIKEKDKNFEKIIKRVFLEFRYRF